MANAYCDLLGITPPRLLDVAIGPSRTHLDALVLVLLAKGEPMNLDEIVAVLAPMWNGTPPDLRVTLQKAWAGREPVVKGAAGRYALDLDSRRMNRFLVRLGLRQPPPSSRPPPFVPPGPEVPLTDDELRACFVHGCPSSVSGARFTAAVLDGVGHPMLPSEVAAVGEGLMVGSLMEPTAGPVATQRNSSGALRLRRTSRRS